MSKRARADDSSDSSEDERVSAKRDDSIVRRATAAAEKLRRVTSTASDADSIAKARAEAEEAEALRKAYKRERSIAIHAAAAAEEQRRITKTAHAAASKSAETLAAQRERQLAVAGKIAQDLGVYADQSAKTVNTHIEGATELLSKLSMHGLGIRRQAALSNRTVDKSYDDIAERLDAQRKQLYAYQRGLEAGVVPELMPVRTKFQNMKLGKMPNLSHRRPVVDVSLHDLVPTFGEVVKGEAVLFITAVKFGCVEFCVMDPYTKEVHMDLNPAGFEVTFRGAPVVPDAAIDVLCCARRLSTPLTTAQTEELHHAPFKVTAAYLDAATGTFVVRFYATFNSLLVWPFGLVVTYTNPRGEVLRAAVPQVDQAIARAASAPVMIGDVVNVFLQLADVPREYATLQALQEAVAVPKSKRLFLEAAADIDAFIDLLASGWFHRDVHAIVLPRKAGTTAPLSHKDLFWYAHGYLKRKVTTDVTQWRATVFGEGGCVAVEIGRTLVSQILLPISVSVYPYIYGPKQYGVANESVPFSESAMQLLRGFYYDAFNVVPL